MALFWRRPDLDFTAPMTLEECRYALLDFEQTFLGWGVTVKFLELDPHTCRITIKETIPQRLTVQVTGILRQQSDRTTQITAYQSIAQDERILIVIVALVIGVLLFLTVFMEHQRPCFVPLATLAGFGLAAAYVRWRAVRVDQAHLLRDVRAVLYNGDQE